MTLQKEIEAAINRYSAENGSDTPDFILAQYLADCLKAFNAAVQTREQWYGRGERVSGGCGPVPMDPTVSVPRFGTGGRTSIDLVAAVGSPFLGGRSRAQGPYSGEAFLYDILGPALMTYNIVEVFLDGILGPTPSFLEEAFGGAVRLYGTEVVHRIRFVAATNAHLVPQITQYMDEAVQAVAR